MKLEIYRILYFPLKESYIVTKQTKIYVYELDKQFYYFPVSCNVSIRENERIKSFVQLTHNGDKINTKVHILVDINSKRTFISLSLYLYPGGRNKKGSILTTQIHKIEPNAFTMRLMQFQLHKCKKC